MREIKFRGKTETTEGRKWVYGYYYKVKSFFDEGVASFIGTIRSNHLTDFSIDENTLGQFTGLKDKNGVEIYEGDIILTQPFRDRPFSQKFKEKRLRGIVYYNIKRGKNFVKEPDKLKYWGAEWEVEIIDKEDYKKYCNCSWGSFFECEVIGNIYDNPELLEKYIREEN